MSSSPNMDFRDGCWYDMPILKVCPCCGKQFQSYRERTIYCSVQCSNEHRSANWEERFWARVEKGEGCWPFRGAKSKDGYGVITIRGEQKSCHRIAYELTYGPIPAGLEVLHSCDTPACCRPDHFFLGTQKDNARDAISKSRFSSGARNGMAKLSEKDVVSIRSRYAAGGISHHNLATEYSVTEANVWQILQGKTWRSLLCASPE